MRLRVGQTIDREIYLQLGDRPSADDPMVGLMLTSEIAARVVDRTGAIPRRIAAEIRGAGATMPSPLGNVGYAESAVVRPDQAHPADWTPLEGGAWLSPSGRRYTSPRIIEPLRERRRALGLPIS